MSVVGYVGVHYSNTVDQPKEHFTNEPVQRVAAPPKAAELSSADREYVRRVAARFIDTAVMRRRIDDSWELTTANLRQGMTRKEWDTGNIPVTPFPAEAVEAIKYRVDWSGEDFVYLKVAIIPKATSTVPGQAFDIGLARSTARAKNGWLVDYWVPSGLGQRTSAQRAAHPSPPVERVSTSIPEAWILAPLAFLAAVIVGLPVAIFGRQRFRSWRSLRAYQRHRA